MSDTGDLSAFVVKNKDVWARVYDEVIAPNLETEWKKRSDQHEKDVKSRDETHRILLNHVNDEIIASARLREENARLKRFLQKYGNVPSPSLEQLETSTPDAAVPAAQYHDIVAKFDELNKRYQAENQKMKYLEKKNAAVMQKNKEMKKSVKAWQEYCDRNINKQKAKTSAAKKDRTETPALNDGRDARLNLPSSPGYAGMASPKSLITKEHSSPAPSSPLLPPPRGVPVPNGASVMSSSHLAVPEMVTAAKENTDVDAEPAEQKSSSLPDENETTPTNARSATTITKAAFLGQSSPAILNSSQTTEDEVTERNSAMNHMEIDDDDVPQVVSERCLKRKRKRSNTMRVYTDRSDGTPAKPIQVKEEMYSSPPVQTTPYELRRNDTIDLDEIPPTMIRTPRHSQLWRPLSIHSNLMGTLRNQRSSSAPFDGSSVKTEPGDESNVPDLTEAVADIVTPDARRGHGRQGEAARMSADILRPLDPNTVAISNHDTPNKRMKRSEMLEREKYDLLMESGEMLPFKGQRPAPSIVRARYNERLRELKDTTPSKTVVGTPKTAPSRVRPMQALAPSSTINQQTHTPSNQTRQPLDPRTEPAPDRRPIWTLTASSEPTRKAAAPSAPKKHQGSLRSKRPDQLCMQDFKPNPAYNQGYSHAFSETVRKQSDRLCLPGCTSAQCCGSSFRALALVSAPLTPSEEETLLQDYLGDAYDSFGLTQMSQDERNDIVLQARTRQMAKKFGKHRQAYERGKSPPGFWRTGFPSTQEVEADKEKAREIEKELVMERWLEAMRKDGKWIFRDE